MQLTTTELAEQLGVTPRRIQQWVDEGRLKPARTLPNGHHLFRPGTRKPQAQKRGPKAKAR